VACIACQRSKKLAWMWLKCHDGRLDSETASGVAYLGQQGLMS
jgi:hypothetical protein